MGQGTTLRSEEVGIHSCDTTNNQLQVSDKLYVSKLPHLSPLKGLDVLGGGA